MPDNQTIHKSGAVTRWWLECLAHNSNMIYWKGGHCGATYDTDTCRVVERTYVAVDSLPEALGDQVLEVLD